MGAGGRVLPPPETSDREISVDLLGKKRQGKKGKMEQKKKKGNQKREGGKLKMEGGRLQNEGLFFAFHFSKPLKIVSGPPKWEFSTGKKCFTSGKKSGKTTLPPLKNIPLMPLLV